MILEALDNARKAIDELQNEEEPILLQNLKTLEQMKIPIKLWGLRTRFEPSIRENAYAALVSIAATQKLKNNGIEPVNALPAALKYISKFCPLRDMKCRNSKYRSIDGTCNNVMQPDWGASGVAMQRIIGPFFADGVSEFRASIVDGSELPNVRLLSNLFFEKKHRSTLKVNMLTAQWAHFIYTDLVHIGNLQLLQGMKQIPFPCCAPKIKPHPECKSIVINKDDLLYGSFLNCLPYTRTMAAPRPNCGLGPREQANQASSFLDASMIYGSTNERARTLRRFTNGHLLTSSDSLNSNMPPTVDLINNILTRTAECAVTGYHCFFSGSDHVNFLPPGIALHAIWIRQHNRIASNLQALNPHWSDEKLYQESRRIVIAQLQHITYNEFLPLLIGKENWIKFGLQPQFFDYSRQYDLDVNPTVINSFAAAAGQFFFTMFGTHLAWYNDDGTKILERPINEYFDDPGLHFFNDRFNGILRFLLRESITRPVMHMNDEFRNKFFKGKGNLGYDLAAMILQTGRDHGIPPYTVWREYCGDGKVESFEKLVNDVDDGEEMVKKLAKVYKSIDDVDLYLLGLAEKPLLGALLGPTFSCIVALQFQKLKKGDRYWYENDMASSGFTLEQLSEIRKTTMAKIICSNTEHIGGIQPRAFELMDNFDNHLMPCNETLFFDMDISKWKEDSPQLRIPITFQTVEKAVELALQQVEERRKRERINIQKNQQHFKSGDPLLSYGKMMRAKREAIAIARVSDVLLQATKNIMTNSILENGNLPDELHMNILQNLLPQIDISTFIGNIEPFLGRGGSVDKCLPKNFPCDHTTPYRTASGWCNNLRNPHFANAFSPLLHLLPPAYEDGMDIPRSKSVTGDLLPSARVISNLLHFDLPFDHQKYSLFIMQFGQILDHEMTHSPVERGPNDEILNCTRCDSNEELSMHCMPLPVPPGDPHFPTHDEKGERRCLPFARSLLGQLTLGYRNQLNQITPYLDGSVLYGSTECEAAELRTFVDGQLNSSYLGVFNPEALPQGDQEQDCRSSPQFPCFVAGDERNSHQPGLTSMHNILLREHNRIARKLAELNPLWDDERIYQETRRIVGAEFAHIAYNEYLPLLLGNRLMRKYDLNTKKNDYFHGYDDTCDASISHPFATAAFRFGHSLVRRFFSRFDAFYNNFTEPVDLIDNFNNVEAIYDGERGSIDSLIVGLLGTAAMAFDRHITTALRNHLFGRRGEPFSGMDLIALNILRARDHGVQPYIAFREFCGFGTVKHFAELLSVMDQSAVDALQSIYKEVADIDLFPGLLSEKPMKGALLPPTMACIIAEQFRRLKKCDRFYYENDQPITRFSKDQLAEIRKVTLSSLLCANSRILKIIQPNAFLLPDELGNAPIPCTHLEHINLIRWIDKPLCHVGKHEIRRGRTKRISPCQSCTCTAEGPQCGTVTVNNCKKLLEKFLFEEIMQDTACIVQCAYMFWEPS